MLSRLFSSISRYVITLLVFLQVFVLFGQNDPPEWKFANHAMPIGSPSSTLQIKSYGRASLSSFKFVGRVGGIALQQVASLGSTMSGQKLKLDYFGWKSTNRFRVISGTDTLYPDLPDWLLIPIANYANSTYNSAVTLFGPESDETKFDINYHAAFENTLLGVRLVQADMMLMDTDSFWELPTLNGRTILGSGEKRPLTKPSRAVWNISLALLSYNYQAWVLTDIDEQVVVNKRSGGLYFTGQPYYNFWVMDSTALMTYQIEEDRLINDANMYSKLALALVNLDGTVYEKNHNSYLYYVDKYEEALEALEQLDMQVSYVNELTNTLRASPYIKQLNPAVWNAVENTMHYAAFFRYYKKYYPSAWQSFLRQVNGYKPMPEVKTPTEWSKF